MNDRTALLLIDVQCGLDAPGLGIRNNPDAERQMAALLHAWRGAGAPLAHVQHLSVRPTSPLRPGQPGVEIKPEVQPLPREPLFQKHSSSAFVGTALEAHLRALGVEHVVVVGLTTEHCVSSTARSAADLGFAVTVVSDATAAFGRPGYDGRPYDGDAIHRAALVSLQDEFAAIRSTAELLG